MTSVAVARRPPILPNPTNFMRSIDLIRENLRRSDTIVLSRVEEMRDHCVVFPTPKGGAHTLWVLGHLAYIESLVVCAFMLFGTYRRFTFNRGSSA